MTTAKARYVGGGDEEPIPDFSEKLKNSLRAFYPNPQAEVDPVWGHPAVAFVEALLGAAWEAKSALYWQRLEITKAELVAENADLLKVLQACAYKLQNLSPDHARILAVNADPRGCADTISLMIQAVAAATPAIEQLKKARKPIEKQYGVAVELSFLVLRVLQQYGIRSGANGDCYFEYASDAVKILKLIGDDLGLVRDNLTWRDLIIEAKRIAKVPQ